jgi:hypothetical protein
MSLAQHIAVLLALSACSSNDVIPEAPSAPRHDASIVSSSTSTSPTVDLDAGQVTDAAPSSEVASFDAGTVQSDVTAVITGFRSNKGRALVALFTQNSANSRWTCPRHLR